MTIRINHNRSTALEGSVMNCCGGGEWVRVVLNPVLRLNLFLSLFVQVIYEIFRSTETNMLNLLFLSSKKIAIKTIRYIRVVSLSAHALYPSAG